jgi:hypothetical protein
MEILLTDVLFNALASHSDCCTHPFHGIKLRTFTDDFQYTNDL